MSTKYKYGENGSYFDPETKRTYYKDPQYQKAYDDEWNRLEKFYKMKQEEQRRIEMANFQRLLAQADALTKSMQALGYKTSLPWEQKNRFDGYENSEIERASKKEDREIQYADAGYDEKGNQQVRLFDKASGRQLTIDPETGELTDGKYLRGSQYITPEVIIKPQHYHSPYGYSSANDWDQLKVLMQAVTDAAKELTPQPVKDKVKDAMASPIVQKTIGSPTVQAALPYLNALSPAAWMDTAYDAMYTPNEINYPWDEGNKGLGSPILDLGFDFAAYPALYKTLKYTGKAGAKAYDKAYDAAVRYDVKQRILHDKWEPKNPERFIESLSKSKRPEFLSKYTPEKLSGDAFELYKLKGYDIGFALHPNENYYLRDIISVHNNSKRAKNIGDYLIEAAKRKGGSTLDHYEGYLSNFYGKHGFKEYERLPWDKKYAPKTWDYETYGEPDVVLRAIPDKDLLEIIKRRKK